MKYLVGGLIGALLAGCAGYLFLLWMFRGMWR